MQTRRKASSHEVPEAEISADNYKLDRQQDQQEANDTSLEDAPVNIKGPVSTHRAGNDDKISPDGTAQTPSNVTASDHRPVQRLASALPSKSKYPAMTSSRSNETRSSTLKFKPKAVVRRSQEERDAIERAESERAAARNSASNAQTKHQRPPFPLRGSGPGSTTRSAHDGFERRNASGPLGGGSNTTNPPYTRSSRSQKSKDTSSEPSRDKSLSSNGKARVKNESLEKSEVTKDADVVMKDAPPGKRKRPGKVKNEERLPELPVEESSDSDTIQRIKIEEINLLNSDDDVGEIDAPDTWTSAGTKRDPTPRMRNWMMRPIFIERQEHVERAVGVNTDASSYTSAELRKRAKARQQAGESLFLSDDDDEAALLSTKSKSGRKPRDVEFVKNKRKWKGVWDTDEGAENVQVKQEPNEEEIEVFEVGDVDQDGNGPMDVDALHKPIEPRGLSEDGKADDDTDSDGSTSPNEQLPLEMEYYKLYDDYAVTSLRHRLFINDPNDDLAELENTNDDIDPELEELRLLREEFYATLRDPSSPSSQVRSHRESKEARKQTHATDPRRSHLVQLPPVMPLLQKADLDKKGIKSEPDASTELPSTPTAGSRGTLLKPKDSNSQSGEKVDIRRIAAYTQGSGDLVGGQAGSLTFHSSGRAIATWGGLSFEVNEDRQIPGQAREVFVMDREVTSRKVDDPSKVEESVELGGESRSGAAVCRVPTNLIVVPDWSTLLE